ncbi:uncharacterized protein EAF01_009169 [Botrytis porri]|uniref:uncharacterized protein n=1 Tax=Botrytis porri TaxID=87229 RepID=UPI0019016B72|nr:uncharacterized protein EAF01_009169 [Botrytis porri]KAF7896766.1 hypothetical protein EAF01_009169 [Botrytis porri]
MESSLRNTRDIVVSHAREMEFLDGNTLKQSSQDTTLTSTTNTNLTVSSPKHPNPSTSDPRTTAPQPPIYPSNSLSNFPFSSNRSGTAPQIINYNNHRFHGLESSESECGTFAYDARFGDQSR